MNVDAIDRILYGVVITVLASTLMYKVRNWRSLSRYLIGFGGGLALVLTWYLLFRFMVLTTGRTLSPWEQWAGFAPPKGTWQRQLNDFFSQDTNQYLIALIIVGISVTAFLKSICQNANNIREKLPLAFAGANVAFLLSSFVLLALIAYLPDLWFPGPCPSVDVGYQRTWPDILSTGILLGLLFWGQAQMSNPSFWNRQATKSIETP